MAVCIQRLFGPFGCQSTVWSTSWRHPSIIRTVTPGALIHNTLCVTQRLPPTTSYSSESANTTTNSKTDLSFEDYRKLRKTLKVRARVAGVPLAFTGMGISSFVNVHLNPHMFETPPEEIQPILGLDPIVFAGLCGVGSGIVSYLLGGAIFTATWRILSKEKAKQLDQKENEFLKRLQIHRFSKVSKYADDYYGEKVMTISDYRQWVRQQQKRKQYVENLNNTKESATEK